MKKMNCDKTIFIPHGIGGEYFVMIYSRKMKPLYRLNELIEGFNFDEYWCFKTTNVQKLVSYDEFLDFKYSGYTFFRKDLYDSNRILEWVEWSRIVFNGNGLQYLSKPTPPFPPQKIIIRK